MTRPQPHCQGEGDGSSSSNNRSICSKLQAVGVAEGVGVVYNNDCRADSTTSIDTQVLSQCG